MASLRVRWMAAAIAMGCAAPAAAAGAYPGEIVLHVDATDVQHRVYRVTETIPVRPGRLKLYYPQWLPGNHAPRGQIDQLTGLRFRAGNRELAWKRDPLNVYAFELQVPAGATRIDAEFLVVTPQVTDASRTPRVVMTPNLLGLQWNQVVLYPANYLARDIHVRASVQLPPGWKHATSLNGDPDAANGAADLARFSPVSLETLVDSPLFAGRHFRQVDLTPAGGRPVLLNLVAEEESNLAVTDEQVAIHRAMVRETIAAFGPPRYARYDFLVALSERMGSIGTEHLQSSENTLGPAYFRSWNDAVDGRDQLPHELAHSWSGKYRRPARLWTPHFNTPMQGDLLWVYEGLTHYYGMVLAARSGLWPQDFARNELAVMAAVFSGRRPGRAWRPLGDTTFQPLTAARRAQPWTSWQRTEDYYQEGALLWLDVDTRIREMTGGRKSLDDFARAFFAAPATHGGISTYEFAEVVRALQFVVPFDWAAFLRTRVEGTNQPVTEGLERAGFRLEFNDRANPVISDYEKAGGFTELSYSLGVSISRDAVLTDVVWDGIAFKAGLTTNTTLVAVNGRAYSAEILKAAITRSGKEGVPIELLVRNQDLFRTVTVSCPKGLQYPHLVPIEGKADGLRDLLAPAG